MSKVGLLAIATGNYTKFIAPLFDSVQQHFMNNHEVTVFVFTDGEILEADNIVRIEQPHTPWPGSTLYRYHIFDKHRALLSEMDYLFYCDADMRFVDDVGDEILPDLNGNGLVGTVHPGFFNKKRGTYEKRRHSTAYVGPKEGETYFAGGFNGGTAEAFLAMSAEIKRNIDLDWSRGQMIAVWHDESHLNRYLIDHPPKKIDPSYCYPESWDLPFPKRLLALDKPHQEIRGVNKAVVKSDWGFTLPYDFAMPVTIWVDHLREAEQDTKGLRVLLLTTPGSVKLADVLHKQNLFDYVLTCDSRILDKAPNAVRFEFGTAWIDPNRYCEPNKQFSVSTVYGRKENSTGQELRRKIWKKQKKIKSPRRFYLSSFGRSKPIDDNPILGERKDPLFESMFHICIEDFSVDYFFTEKLLDAFLSKTIPIYWGCSNIEEYFNPDGIIRVKNARQLIRRCNSLTEQDYTDRSAAIEENYQKALEWVNYRARLRDKIEELAEKSG